MPYGGKSHAGDDRQGGNRNKAIWGSKIADNERENAADAHIEGEIDRGLSFVTTIKPLAAAAMAA